MLNLFEAESHELLLSDSSLIRTVECDQNSKDLLHLAISFETVLSVQYPFALKHPYNLLARGRRWTWLRIDLRSPPGILTASINHLWNLSKKSGMHRG